MHQQLVLLAAALLLLVTCPASAQLQLTQLPQDAPCFTGELFWALFPQHHTGSTILQQSSCCVLTAAALAVAASSLPQQFSSWSGVCQCQ